ncbi:GbsR/MarR family transcriptional regulator [Thermococcus waiotapuensis]|uniref:GbsR/MarR family transcriptional regulator n=1 Tax=Thermococcus waiotapuensis TaxID=90909 RepID=A0AAE4NUT9_9EURY|nr:GbsR/MarR family transcriptional regulator [Thermococcus waiotapuensis]MDV3103519.1 GbsR/MarR family transcriptional regulator [Thermococcus waiotapuensis]
MTTGAEETFVSSIERLMVRWGYTHSEGRVYGALLISPRALTIGEIVRITELSRSTVSSALAHLIRAYVITVYVNGRKKMFSAVPGLLELFLKQPKDILKHEVKPALESLEELGVEGPVLEDLKSLECLLEALPSLESRFKCPSPEGGNFK